MSILSRIYLLSLTICFAACATTAAAQSDTDNSCATANRMTVVSSGGFEFRAEARGTIGGSDAIDIYRIEFPFESDISIFALIAAIANDLDLFILDDSCLGLPPFANYDALQATPVLAFSTRPRHPGEMINGMPVRDGQSYFVAVASFDGARTDYALAISAIDSPSLRPFPTPMVPPQKPGSFQPPLPPSPPPTPSPAGGDLSNLSYNGPVSGVGIIPGIIVQTAGEFVITAEGLQSGDGAAAIADPQVSIRVGLQGTQPIASATSCSRSDIAALIGRNLLGNNPACLVVSLQPGPYFISASGVNGGSGNMLLGVISSPSSSGKLSNLSYNGPVSGAGIIPGIIVQTAGEFVITAEGLQSGDGAAAIADPQVSIRVGLQGTQPIASTTSCSRSDIAALIGRNLLGNNPACLVVSLQPGPYFISASGVNGGSGNMLLGVIRTP